MPYSFGLLARVAEQRQHAAHARVNAFALDAKVLAEVNLDRDPGAAGLARRLKQHGFDGACPLQTDSLMRSRSPSKFPTFRACPGRVSQQKSKACRLCLDVTRYEAGPNSPFFSQKLEHGLIE